MSVRRPLPRSLQVLTPAALALAALLLPAAAVAAPLKPGDAVPDFTLTDTQGKEHHLEALRGKVVVLIVWSSRCPQSRSYGVRLERLRKALDPKRVALLGLAPSRGETNEAVDAARREAKMELPVALDPDGGVCKSLGAVTTPTAYVVDGEGRLRYVGAIDDDPRGRSEQPTSYVEQAVRALLAGEDPPRTKVPNRGFKIRY